MNLILFFTRHLNLATWNMAGMFDREVALYKELQTLGVDVGFVTYGKIEETRFQRQIPGIRILYNKWMLPGRWYNKWIHRLHPRAMRRADIIKTNQTDGAEWALKAARLYNKPLLARCGYMWSEFMARDYGPDSPQHRRALAVEQEVFSGAARVVVTTPAMRDDVEKRIPEAAGRVRVVPNFVLTDQFTPKADSTAKYDLAFVGRLAPQKNVAALLEAVAQTRATLLIIGEGELKDELQSRYGDLDGRVRWSGRVPNPAIPSLLASAKIFVLPSLFEGHPKTLVEAMSCGRPVLGTDVPGIREAIHHGRTGWLCGTDAPSLQKGIKTLLADPELCATLGSNAREHAVANYSLRSTAEREKAVYEEILAENKLSP